MRSLIFAKRNAKEILRDPANLFFGLAFPIVLLILFSVINAAIPAEAQNAMFEIKNTAPGIAMFGTAFMALFAGMLLSKDRTSSFLMRLFTSPMRSIDFIIGYTLPIMIFAVAQSAITLIAAVFLGLPLTVNLLLAIVVLIPIALMFVGIGLLCGGIMNDKAVGGICGALLTNVAGFLSGVWVPIDLIGGGLKAVSEVLPFYHSVEAARYATTGNYGDILPHLLVVLAYAIVIYAAAVVVFKRRMSGDKV